MQSRPFGLYLPLYPTITNFKDLLPSTEISSPAIVLQFAPMTALIPRSLMSHLWTAPVVNLRLSVLKIHWTGRYWRVGQIIMMELLISSLTGLYVACRREPKHCWYLCRRLQPQTLCRKNIWQNSSFLFIPSMTTASQISTSSRLTVFASVTRTDLCMLVQQKERTILPIR